MVKRACESLICHGRSNSAGLPDQAAASDPCALFQKECADFDITPLQYSLLTALAARGTADQTTLAADVAPRSYHHHRRAQAPAVAHFVERSILDRDRGRRLAG